MVLQFVSVAAEQGVMAREAQTPTPSRDVDVFGKELPLTCKLRGSPRESVRMSVSTSDIVSCVTFPNCACSEVAVYK